MPSTVRGTPSALCFCDLFYFSQFLGEIIFRLASLLHMEEIPSEWHACIRRELSDWWIARILQTMVQVPWLGKINLFKICKATTTGESSSSLSARPVQGSDSRQVHLLRWLAPYFRWWCGHRWFTSPALLATGLNPCSPICCHFHLYLSPVSYFSVAPEFHRGRKRCYYLLIS